MEQERKKYVIDNMADIVFDMLSINELVDLHNEYCKAVGKMRHLIFTNDESFFESVLSNNKSGEIAKIIFNSLASYNLEDSYVQCFLNDEGDLTLYSFNAAEDIPTDFDDIASFIIENETGLGNEKIEAHLRRIKEQPLFDLTYCKQLGDVEKIQYIIDKVGELPVNDGINCYNHILQCVMANPTKIWYNDDNFFYATSTVDMPTKKIIELVKKAGDEYNLSDKYVFCNSSCIKSFNALPHNFTVDLATRIIHSDDDVLNVFLKYFRQPYSVADTATVTGDATVIESVLD
jgi:hypothetical protein